MRYVTQYDLPRRTASQTNTHAKISVPVVSIIIPVLNGAAFIAFAIESVLSQTMRDFELIVIDDGSTDATSDIVHRYEDARIHYVYQPNRGLSAARNSGIQRATARWIAFLDCDDYWLPRKLEAQLERARGIANTGFVYCAALHRGPDGTELGTIPALVEGDVLESLLLSNCIAGSASSAMIRRDVIECAGLFDEGLRFCEDWDMWLRLASITRIAKVDEPLVCIVRQSGSLGKNAIEVRNASLAVLERALDRHAASRSVRARAYWYVYWSAAITLQEHRAFGLAAREMIRALSHRPFFARAYWRLLRILLRRA